MNWKRLAHLAGSLLLLQSVLLMGCNIKLRVPVDQIQPGSGALAVTKTSIVIPTAVIHPTARPTPAAAIKPPAAEVRAQEVPTQFGEPAGCQSLEEAQRGATTEERLARASQMLELSNPLSSRIVPEIWNAYSNRYVPYTGDVISLNVNDVQKKYFIQWMMNALQVNGYVTWLRNGTKGGLRILAIPLWRGDWSKTDWAPYLEAYWQDSRSIPDGDSSVIPVRKTPPCKWMVDQGLAPQVGADWLPASSTNWPDYASTAAAYLADTNQAANAVARRIGWLAEGLEGADTMCGPLSWSILRDAGVFPPGWGGWLEGPKSFWLADPRNNGRPWSLFPPDSYRLYQFRQPLSKFDFSGFRLFPGDFLYTYSINSGFDHMMVITEVDSEGNVYSVTNLVQVYPVEKTTIERVLVLNLNDPTVGIVRNQWANGITGHDGFDVFRWAWAEKDMLGQPVKYLVQVGDTLPAIAAQWKTPVMQIARYNDIKEDAVLAVGQELQIPPNATGGPGE